MFVEDIHSTRAEFVSQSFDSLSFPLLTRDKLNPDIYPQRPFSSTIKGFDGCRQKPLTSQDSEKSMAIVKASGYNREPNSITS